MMNFDFIAPTRIIFGEGKEKLVGEILKEYGFKTVLLVYGGGHIKKTGLYDDVVNSLNEAGIKFVECGGIRANPIRTKVLEGRETARKASVDAILAVGGGSVIDTAKSIAVGYYYDGDPFDFNLKKAVPTRRLPLGVILTIASAGSEMSDSAVVQDDETQVKSGFNNKLNRPLFAIENPLLTLSAPKYQIAAGVADTMMHSLERYFEPSFPHQLSDEWALALIKNVMETGKAFIDNPNDVDAAAALMLASSLSHSGYTDIGKKNPGWVVHPLEHALSGYSAEITHGAGVAMIYSAWAEHVYAKDPSKFAKLTEALFHEKGANENETAIMGVREMKKFFASIGMPTSFKEVGLSEKDIAPLVSLASGNGTRVIGCYPQSLDKRDIEAIYRSLL